MVGVSDPCILPLPTPVYVHSLEMQIGAKSAPTR